VNIKDLLEAIEHWPGYSFCLNEMLAVCRNSASSRLAPAGPRLRAAKISPGDFVRKNLAASFAGFPLNFVPFMQYAGRRRACI